MILVRPKFDSLHKGAWPHRLTDGVGLRLEGWPRDPAAFIAYLMDRSCHPNGARRILRRIYAHGFDRVTVMSALNFDEIAVGLARMGVLISIIAPQSGWEKRFHDGPFPPDYITPHMRNVARPKDTINEPSRAVHRLFRSHASRGSHAY